ncbi:MAG: Na+/H+ antiporter subunit E [Anaerolineales bacterium]|jgi:multisubunit Na+/H+ antiporter MnhE subunit
MTRVIAGIVLLMNFIKELVVSGWVTAGIILGGQRNLHPGLVRMPYGDLDEHAASLLAALITLTPGTTTIDIDLQRREFLLHLLDAQHSEATLTVIRRNFLVPVRSLFGKSP